MSQSRPRSGPSARFHFRDTKPYAIPDSLDDLRGPADGEIRLPHSVLWAPGHGLVRLGDEGGIGLAYRALLSEGTQEEQVSLLNRARLVEVWPELLLPARVRHLWERRFPELRPASAA